MKGSRGQVNNKWWISGGSRGSPEPLQDTGEEDYIYYLGPYYKKYGKPSSLVMDRYVVGSRDAWMYTYTCHYRHIHLPHLGQGSSLDIRSIYYVSRMQIFKSGKGKVHTIDIN